MLSFFSLLIGFSPIYKSNAQANNEIFSMALTGDAIITRKLSSSDNSLLTLLFAGTVGTIVMSFFMPGVWIQPSNSQWIMMALIGFIAAIAHLFIILSLKLADASKLAPLGYTEIITNILLSYYIFNELPDNWTYLGLFIIVLCGLYISRREYYLSKLYIGK